MIQYTKLTYPLVEKIHPLISTVNSPSPPSIFPTSTATKDCTKLFKNYDPYVLLYAMAYLIRLCATKRNLYCWLYLIQSKNNSRENVMIKRHILIFLIKKQQMRSCEKERNILVLYLIGDNWKSVRLVNSIASFHIIVLTTMHL